MVVEDCSISFARSLYDGLTIGGNDLLFGSPLMRGIPGFLWPVAGLLPGLAISVAVIVTFLYDITKPEEF